MILNEKHIKPELPTLKDKHTAHEKGSGNAESTSLWILKEY